MAVCAEAERKKECVGDRDAGESERWGGGCRGETCYSDVTSAAGRQDGRGKLACATAGRRGRIGRRLNVWEGKNDFLSKMCKPRSL